MQKKRLVLENMKFPKPKPNPKPKPGSGGTNDSGD